MKKSTLIMILSLVLAVALGVGGTLAYLTDEDGDINVMTVGHVTITQNEQERVEIGNPDAGLDEFTQNKPMNPAVIKSSTKETVDANGWDVDIRKEVKNYIDKIVSVTNTGSTDAYVRTIYAIPEAGNFLIDDPSNASEQWLHWNGVSDSDHKDIGGNGWFWGTKENGLEWPGNEAGWHFYNDVVLDVNGAYGYYDIFIATNVNPLKPGETTAPSLLGLYLDPRVDCDVDPVTGVKNYTFTTSDGTEYNLEDISTLNVLALSQAVQADGFDTAWEAFEAAFPISYVDGYYDDNSFATWFADLVPGTPGDKWPSNNPPLKADVVVSSLEELKAALAEAKENGEPVVIDAKGIGVDLDNVTFPDGTVVMNLKVNGASNYGNGVNGTVTFINCEFVSGSTYAAHFDHGNTTNDQVVFQNCVLKGWNSFGTAIEGLTFDRCTFGHNGSYGIVRMYQSAAFNNCTFNDDLEGIDIHEACLNGTTVSFNDCEGLDVTDLHYNTTDATKAKAAFVIDGVDVSEQVTTW